MTSADVAGFVSTAAPIAIASQGSFAVGGTVITNDGSFDPRDPMNPAGQTLHGDHARLTFQIPVDARPLPLLLWHGWWVDGSCWDTTPDGREGFRTLFLRRGFPVYLLDQPRRGSAGKTTVSAEINTEPDEQWFFNQFRFGLWPDLYEGGQFASDPAALEQFFRAMVPDTGPLDSDVIVAAASAAIDRIGPLVLITHSHAGGFGWLTQLRNSNVKAVVSIEPGSGFVFPEPSDGVVSRAQIAQTLVASLTSPAADRKTLELVAESGPAQADLDPLFSALQPDPVGEIDGVQDRPNMPLEQEPQEVVAELRAFADGRIDDLP